MRRATLEQEPMPGWGRHFLRRRVRCAVVSRLNLSEPPILTPMSLLYSNEEMSQAK